MDKDWEVVKKGRHTVIQPAQSPDARSGIEFTLNKSKQLLYVFGWYDSMVGIPGFTISLEDLCAQFGMVPVKLTKTEMKARLKANE